MSDLSALIATCILEKQGDKEFALFYFGGTNTGWRADIGCPSKHVSLGEIDAEISADGETAETAVFNLLTTIMKANKA